MNQNFIILLGLLGVLALSLLCFSVQQPIIEEELTARTNEALQAKGLAWATANANGQSIELTGISPTAESRDEAVGLAKAIYGVTAIDNRLLLANLDKETDQQIDPQADKAINKEPNEKSTKIGATKPNTEADTSQEKEEVPTTQARTEVDEVATEQEQAATHETKTEKAIACQHLFNNLLKQQNIRFESGSAKLTTNSTPLLNELTQIIQSCPGYHIIIAGHTDSSGSAKLNQRLSQQRADSVRNALVRGGIDTSILSSIGFGDTRPIADNNTPDGMTKNRRITFRVAHKAPSKVQEN